MELKDLMTSKSIYVTAGDIAPILGVDPQSLRNQAREDPSKLGFPTTVVGNRVMFPRKPFLKWLGAM